jgi:hypothetical protein
MLPPPRRAPLCDAHERCIQNARCSYDGRCSIRKSWPQSACNLPLVSRLCGRNYVRTLCAHRIAGKLARAAGTAAFACRRTRGSPPQPDPHPLRPRTSRRIPRLKGPPNNLPLQRKLLSKAEGTSVFARNANHRRLPMPHDRWRFVVSCDEYILLFSQRFS